MQYQLSFFVLFCAVQVPGQFVGVRPPGQGKGLGDNQQLYSIACSPYESRRDSAYIGGSIIEVRSSAAGGKLRDTMVGDRAA